uniref:Uncharacterized protein n=1 Tax=Oryza brachyantha TaxID=4533 RepID=J3LYL1_ORYBR
MGPMSFTHIHNEKGIRDLFCNTGKWKRGGDAYGSYSATVHWGWYNGFPQPFLHTVYLSYLMNGMAEQALSDEMQMLVISPTWSTAVLRQSAALISSDMGYEAQEMPKEMFTAYQARPRVLRRIEREAVGKNSGARGRYDSIA